MQGPSLLESVAPPTPPRESVMGLIKLDPEHWHLAGYPVPPGMTRLYIGKSVKIRVYDDWFDFNAEPAIMVRVDAKMPITWGLLNDCKEAVFGASAMAYNLPLFVPTDGVPGPRRLNELANVGKDDDQNWFYVEKAASVTGGVR